MVCLRVHAMSLGGENTGLEIVVGCWNHTMLVLLLVLLLIDVSRVSYHTWLKDQAHGVVVC